jgi:ribosomal protein S18 acetylase RimI-like enzyme
VPTETYTTFRNLEQSDMPAILDIEAESGKVFDPFLDRIVTDSSTWTATDFEYCLSEKNTRGIVVLEGDWLVGYLLYELERDGYRIRHLVIHPHCRRVSIGTAVVSWLLAKCERSERRIYLRACVDETNVDACHFFAALGFESKLVRGRQLDAHDWIEFFFCVAEDED